MSQDPTLGYSVTVHTPIVVLLFSGHFNVRCVETLEACTGELALIKDIQHVIIDFSNVAAFTLDGVPALAQFQKSIRQKEINLRLSGLSDELRTKLVRLGVIRQNEVSPGLKDALVLIKKGVKTISLAPEARKNVA